jgi:predicted alpha/beta-fold hydrolase
MAVATQYATGRRKCAIARAWPALILNARNDSFLGATCYPLEATDTNNKILLEMPVYGGHVGFYGSGGYYYSEKRAINFLNGIK